jgi:anthranilate phosphoribosyltransferase
MLFISPCHENVGPIRKELRLKLFLCWVRWSIHHPQNQLVGVFNLELARIYAYLYQNTDVNVTILHSLDGYDEVSLTGPTKIITSSMEGAKSSDFGVNLLSQRNPRGDKQLKSAQMFTNIISGNGTEAQNVVCANAGMAIATTMYTARRIPNS